MDPGGGGLLLYMEQRLRTAHKAEGYGFRISKILKYGSHNLNIPLEMGMGIFLTSDGRGCQFSICNFGFLSL